MSDFLISLNTQYSGQSLLELLKQPYGARAPQGEYFTMPWGSLAILHERLVAGRNIIAGLGTVCAWVSDLLLSNGDTFASLPAHMSRLRHVPGGPEVSLRADTFLAGLNGTYAIIGADAEGVSLVTHLLNAVPVYYGLDGRGRLVALGTHADLVAAVSDLSLHIDPASAGEFINRGTPLFPYTIHANVREFEPGRLFRIDACGGDVRVTSHAYWSPPREMQDECNEGLLAGELTGILRDAVRVRCGDKAVVVKLSGGMDSRVILAAIPESVECVTMTFCDEPNRESAVARRVARAYRRPWQPLLREKEYIANNLPATIRLSGCEHDWVHAHTMGLLDEILRHDAGCVFDGQWSNAFLRLYFAGDVARVNRLGGLLPARYEKVAYDYTANICPFCREHLNAGVVEQMRSRRRDFHDRSVDPSRGSVAEWLDNYPLTQEAPLSSWLVERRLLPLRMVYLDRRVIEFGYRCPLSAKLGKGVFMKAVLPILGPGRLIPDANDGVRPDSGHLRRLAQRAVRKLQDGAAAVGERLGARPRVQHSWHDYQGYWRDSGKLARFAEEYGYNLDLLDGMLFVNGGRGLLRRKDIDWHYGFRLLQLAVWMGIFREYAAYAGSARAAVGRADGRNTAASAPAGAAVTDGGT